MTSPTSSFLVLREPAQAELGRVAYLFRNSHVPAQSRVLAVVKSRPAERFVAAAAWWMEGTIARFKLTALPGSADRNHACAMLINQLADSCRAVGIQTLHYGELLTGESEWIDLLKEHGFSSLRSERFFEVSAAQAWTRTMEMFQKYQSFLPTSWRTDSIRQHAPEALFELVAPYRLMRPEELRQAWRPDSPQGFDLDCSSILFDQCRPIGAMLLRQARDAFFVDVRVVQAENRMLRSLGNVMLFYHVAQRHDPSRFSGLIHRLQFRGGETEHRETANLALRMGGRELPPRHVFAKPLG